MKEENISQKVFEKINEKDVKIKPRCYFTAKSLMWLLFSGSLFLITILIVSSVSYYIHSYEPMVLITQKPLLLISSLPYVLIVLAILLIYFASRAYRQSRSRCSHEEWTLLGAIIFGALVIGISIFYANLDKKIQAILEKNRLYQGMVTTPKEFWSQPEKGTLSGIVVDLGSGKEFYLQSWDGRKWTVYKIEKSIENETSNNKVAIKRSIRMIGEQENPSRFIAWTVWQW